MIDVEDATQQLRRALKDASVKCKKLRHQVEKYIHRLRSVTICQLKDELEVSLSDEKLFDRTLQQCRESRRAQHERMLQSTECVDLICSLISPAANWPYLVNQAHVYSVALVKNLEKFRFSIRDPELLSGVEQIIMNVCTNAETRKVVATTKWTDNLSRSVGHEVQLSAAPIQDRVDAGLEVYRRFIEQQHLKTWQAFMKARYEKCRALEQLRVILEKRKGIVNTLRATETLVDCLRSFLDVRNGMRITDDVLAIVNNAPENEQRSLRILLESLTHAREEREMCWLCLEEVLAN